MMGLDFFKRSIELVEQYRRPLQLVAHTIQTNGVLIDERCAAFFKEHNFLVGLSVDGPRDLHDTYRVDKRGKGSYGRVMVGYIHLSEAEVDVNVLCTVHAANQDRGAEVYRFFRYEMGCGSSSSSPSSNGTPRRCCRWPTWVGAPKEGETPAVRSAGQPRHSSQRRRRGVRPIPDRRVRGVGEMRRW